ncbi:MAG: hypothetical protein EOM23_04245 [Candidatus Moranbacteria bacterium]|nr:hypothetical protein [Candidatus Moranbacteria bacterium]
MATKPKKSAIDKKERPLRKKEEKSAVENPKVNYLEQFRSFVTKHNAKIIYALVGIIALILLFSFIRITLAEKRFEKEKTTLITQYETAQDSLQLRHIEFASKVFSWSVRSEFFRENIENLNQLVITFVRESGANLVQLIDPDNRMVILSSDKRFENELYENTVDWTATDVVSLKDGDFTRVVTPIMGLNRKIAILVVEYENQRILQEFAPMLNNQ